MSARWNYPAIRGRGSTTRPLLDALTNYGAGFLLVSYARSATDWRFVIWPEPHFNDRDPYGGEEPPLLLVTQDGELVRELDDDKDLCRIALSEDGRRMLRATPSRISVVDTAAATGGPDLLPPLGVAAPALGVAPTPLGLGLDAECVHGRGRLGPGTRSATDRLTARSAPQPNANGRRTAAARPRWWW